MLEIQNIMSPSPITVFGDTPLPRCAIAMRHNGIRHLPVVDLRGHLESLLRDADLLQHGALASDDESSWITFLSDPVASIASEAAIPVAVTAQPTESLASVLARWKDSGQDAVVVVDEHGIPVGIVTEHDLLQLTGHLPEGPVDASGFPVSVTSETSIRAAHDLMGRHHVRHLLIVRGGRAVGVTTLQDLVRPLGEGDGTTPIPKPARTLVTAPPGTTLKEAAEIMAEQHIGCLPIVAIGGVVRGIVTRRDVMAALVGRVDSP